MPSEITVEDLRRLPIFWSRLGFCYDPPRLAEGGQPVVFSKDFEHYQRYHRDMCEAGIKLHTCILFSGWIGVGKYDYTLTDKVLDTVMQTDPSVLYMPRIKLNVPVDWCAAYPEEVFTYENAPHDADGIRALVNTPAHDYLGYESPSGYYAPGYRDDRPNVGGIISMQSLSSRQWLRDAGDALRRLLDHIENGPYADRIFAYQVSFGPCGENHTWGRNSKHYGDYGISNLRSFYDFGIKKYGTVSALSDAWCQPGITRDTVVLPSAKDRYDTKEDLCSLFRGTPQDVISSDYDEYLSRSVTQAIEHFGKIIKLRTGKPVGSFYGYYQFCFNASYSGHLDIETLLRSPYVDFLAAPMSYYRRQAGEPGGEMCDAMSVNRKKLWVDEIDCRTYLCTNSEASWVCKNLEEVRFCLGRELCKDIAHRSGFWWMDLGDGWFDSPEILNEIRIFTALSDQLRRRKNRSAADVLFVTDECSMSMMKMSESLHFDFLKKFEQDLILSGVIIDTCRESDLAGLDLSKYRLIVFAYDFCLGKETLDALPIPPDTSLFFNYCVGIRNGDTVSLKNTEKLTGFSLSEEPGKRYPALICKDAADGIAERAENGRSYFLNTSSGATPEKLRETAKRAGCRFSAPEGCFLYGTEDYVGVFAWKDSEGTFVPPAPGVWAEYRSMHDTFTSGCRLALKKADFRIFVRKEEN